MVWYHGTGMFEGQWR